jgi:DNA processing protein
MIEEPTHKLLALSRLKGIGKAKLNSLIENVELDKSVEDLCKYSLKMNFTISDFESAREYADFQLREAGKYGHVVLTPFSSDYPKQLNLDKERPPILYCAGNPKVLNQQTVAVIGTREPTKSGVEIAKRLTSWLVDEGFCIVSGLAKGIDTVAHETAVEAKGNTVAVLAHGLDKVYPAQNRALLKDITDRFGCAISEYGYGTTVRGQFLVQRDYIQAGVSQGVVLVQSDLTGGSLHASRKILSYNRALFIAGQSKSDIASGKRKIMANMLLLSSDEAEIKKILKVNSYPNELLFKLQSKDDYGAAIKLLREKSAGGIANETRGLF